MPLLIFILLLKALIVLGVIHYAGVHLAPDEAQYWTWSQALDFGYYSKPPGIAWQIFLGTKFFGNTELGVRFFSIVFSFLTTIATYFLALTCKLSKRGALLAALAFAFSPVGFLNSIFATTDVGMTFFWTLSTLTICYAFFKNKPICYPILGLLIACGALFKWPIYAFWPFVFIFDPSFKIAIGIAISLLGLLPSLFWNFSHNWVTFRHVFATLQGGSMQKEHLSQANFLDFFTAQIGLISPILFLFLLLSLYGIFKNRSSLNKSLLFCAVSSFSLLGIFLFLSFLKKIQGNWSLFIYPTVFVIMAWEAMQSTTKKIGFQIGIIFSLILSLFTFSIPTLQQGNPDSSIKIPYKLNPFRQNLGWDQLQEILQKAGYDPESQFLFSDKYQNTSLLSFYSLTQKRAYFFNLSHLRQNQFSFWPSMSQKEKGKTGFFVFIENLDKNFNENISIESYLKKLNPYFDHVSIVKKEILYSAYNHPEKIMIVFKCVGYNGEKPLEPALY